MGRSGLAGRSIELIYENPHDKEQLKKLLHNPWKAFSQAVERAVAVRAHNLKARINERV